MGYSFMKKILILCLGLASFSNVWADDASELYSKYDALSEEGKAYVKQQMKKDGWSSVSSGNEFESFVHYDYVKPLSNGLTDVWIKYVVVNDVSKDGLGLGDYFMNLSKFNCSDQTYKHISATSYQKNTGKVIDSYTYPTYSNYEAVIPESAGDKQMYAACFISYIKTH